MKLQKTLSTSFFACIILIYTLSAATSEFMSLNKIHHLPYLGAMSMPDTVYNEDSSILVIGDTLFGYEDGLDSIFLITSDTIIDSTIYRKFKDSEFQGSTNYLSNARIINSDEIGINIKNDINTINEGLFGFHIEGMFRPLILGEDGDYSEQGWDWMSDLKPKTIRFPGGASSRFMHLYPYRNIDGLPGLDSIKGYGYDIFEIIRYFDVTDGTIDILTLSDAEDIIDDLDVGDADGDNNGECDDCDLWMNDDLYLEEFDGNFGRWQEEMNIPTGANQSAVTQFIHLIEQIQTENPGHIVDVLLCLNILSESASQCKSIVTQLRTAGVNVVGVELGNEVYFDWSTDMLGINNFSNYWNFIRGNDPNATWTTNFYEYVFSDEMKEEDGLGNNIGHNYVKAFKGDPLFTCKVGIPAENLPNNTGYALREIGFPGVKANWNTSLRSKYDEIYPHSTRRIFDAVILHPYYDAVTNYQQIIYDNFSPPYTCPVWDYSTSDTRLQTTFRGVLGTSLPQEDGNFSDFIKSRYMESYNQHNLVLDFWDETADKKELWTTEWNIKDNGKDLNEDESTADDIAMVEIVNQSFAHGMVLMEWWLKNLKINFNPNYADNFFTYSTVQNYSQTGYATAMLLDADCGDFRNYGLIPSDYNGDRYFMKRTGYYTMSLLSEIIKNDLEYVRSNFTIGILNRNVQPTVFIDHERENLFIYFSNIKETTQNYVINANDLIPLYEDAVGLQLDDAYIYCIDALQGYSSSGKSTLFDDSPVLINDCYSCNSNGSSGDTYHPFEIREENLEIYFNSPECLTELDQDEACVTVKPYSLGYIRISISPYYDHVKSFINTNTESSLFIYPNPTHDAFHINIVGEEQEKDLTELNVEIYNLTGELIQELKTEQNAPITIKHLKSGIYFIKGTTFENKTFIQKLIVID